MPENFSPHSYRTALADKIEQTCIATAFAPMLTEPDWQEIILALRQCGPKTPQLEEWARNELVEECNHLKYGSCMTLRCLKTNGCGIAHAVHILDATSHRQGEKHE